MKTFNNQAFLTWCPELFLSLKHYSAKDFFSDFKAGLLVSVVAFPLFMTFAIASGVPPYIGLITCVIAGGLASILGGAKFQIVGPTGAFTVIVYNIIQEHGFEGLTCSLFFASLMIIAFGLLKLGNLIRYVPYPITSGFTAGIGLSIISAQLGSFLGLSLTATPTKFIDKMYCYISNLETINLFAFGLGVISLFFLQIMQKKKPSFPRYLFVLAGGILFSLTFQNTGIETIGSKFGELSNNLPALHIPNKLFSLDTFQTLFPAAFTIAFLGSIENLLGALISDNLSGKTHRPNLELVSQGIANLFSSLFGGIPATCALGTTSLNVKVGAKSPIAGLFNVIFLAAFMIFLGKWVQIIPMACLAAMLISAAWNMIAFDRTKYIFLAPKRDSMVFVITVLATLLFDIVFAVELGLILAAFLFIKTSIETINIDTFVEKDENGYEQVKINGNLFFGATPILTNVLNGLPKTHKFIHIDMSNVSFIDVSGAQVLKEFVSKVKENNIEVYISGLNARTVHVLEKMDKKHMDLYGHLIKDIDFQKIKEGKIA